MRKKYSVVFSVFVSLVVCFSFVGCGGQGNEATESSQETTKQEQSTAQEYKDDIYADSAKYLSDYKVIEGNGYNVIVSNDLKGDFSELRFCALYTMKKAYKELKTRDMGVFGYFEDGVETAFYYDGSYGDNTIYVYENWESPKGGQWVLSPDDWKYIEGED